MKKEMLDKITELRRRLHENPEVSGQEEKTKRILEDFLRAHTSMELHPCGRGFYAAHREQEKKKPSICLRADYDALAIPGGGASHLCGHDGHSAALCGAALMLEGSRVGRDVFFLFQPEEETGNGAPGCMEIFDKENVGEIYGGHNLPGKPLGQVYTRGGTLSCGSMGLTVFFTGKAAHAATPENGISPALAVGRLLCSLPSMAKQEDYEGLILATVIGAQMGEKAFGAAAADAQVWITLRGEHDRDLEELYRRVQALSQELAAEYGLVLKLECQDVFPATENDDACARKVLEIGHGVEMSHAMRWSEDFGHYLKRCRGAYFIMGAGEEQTPLHGEGYEYPDALLEPAAEFFWKLIVNE